MYSRLFSGTASSSGGRRLILRSSCLGQPLNLLVSRIPRSMNSRTRDWAVALGLVAALWWLAHGRSPLGAPSGAVVDGYRVVNVYPHDPNAYTQGLIYRDGFLFEST